MPNHTLVQNPLNGVTIRLTEHQTRSNRKVYLLSDSESFKNIVSAFGEAKIKILLNHELTKAQLKGQSPQHLLNRCAGFRRHVRGTLLIQKELYEKIKAGDLEGASLLVKELENKKKRKHKDLAVV